MVWLFLSDEEKLQSHMEAIRKLGYMVAVKKIDS